MTTKRTVSHAHTIAHAHATKSSTTEDAPEVAAPTATAAPGGQAAPPATSAPAAQPASPGGGNLYLAPPPANALIPQPPKDFVPDAETSYRGLSPSSSELIALPRAVSNLQGFSDYAQIIGATAPPYEEVLQFFEVVSQWSAMRTASSAWDAYCREQEGMGWATMRALMDRLRPAFLLAARTNPSVLKKYSGLAMFLGARAASASKAVATRKANKERKAKGEPPTHGKAGKAKQRAAAKAALAAQLQAPVTQAAPAASAVPSTPSLSR
jgi:hypothetical protein